MAVVVFASGMVCAMDDAAGRSGYQPGVVLDQYGSTMARNVYADLSAVLAAWRERATNVVSSKTPLKERAGNAWASVSSTAKSTVSGVCAAVSDSRATLAAVTSKGSQAALSLRRVANGLRTEATAAVGDAQHYVDSCVPVAERRDSVSEAVTEVIDEVRDVVQGEGASARARRLAEFKMLRDHNFNARTAKTTEMRLLPVLLATLAAVALDKASARVFDAADSERNNRFFYLGTLLSSLYGAALVDGDKCSKMVNHRAVLVGLLSALLSGSATALYRFFNLPKTGEVRPTLGQEFKRVIKVGALNAMAVKLSNYLQQAAHRQPAAA